jgi:hypothetical protein
MKKTVSKDEKRWALFMPPAWLTLSGHYSKRLFAFDGYPADLLLRHQKFAAFFCIESAPQSEKAVAFWELLEWVSALMSYALSS